jgi:hypothetical protein
VTPAELIGATGVALLLLAFALTSFGWLGSRSALYHAMNVLGAGLSCTASAMIGFVPFVVLEGTWAVVALVALVRALWVSRPRRGRRPKVRSRTTRRARKNPTPYISPEPGTDSQTEVMGQGRVLPDDITAPLSTPRLSEPRGRAAGREGPRD